MKQGKSLEELAAELQSIRQRKQDFIIDTRQLRVLTSEGGTELLIPTTAADEAPKIELQMRPHVHRQIGQHLKVRADFYDRLREQHPPLYDHLINGLFDREPDRRMVRVLRGAEYGEASVARAFLSDRYRRLDCDEVAESVLPILGELPGVQFHSCEMTDTRLYIKAVFPATQVDLNELITGQHVILPNGGDVVQAGVVIQNSDVGMGALQVQPMLFRLVCLNGLIRPAILRKLHVGAEVKGQEDFTIYSDETLAADDRAIMLKVRDAVRSAVDEVQFRAIAQQFAESKLTEPLAKPVEAMQVLADKVTLTDGERDGVLAHLLKGGDLTKFGTINAITRASQDVKDYDRATELEELGSTVMDMPSGEWSKLAAVGA